MDISLMITVPKEIYDIYAHLAEKIDNYSVDKVMADALRVYAVRTFYDLQTEEQPAE